MASSAPAAIRLGNVVEDEDLLGMLVHEPNRLRQVTFEDQDVVTKVQPGQVRDATIEIIAKHVVVVGFGLKDMTDAAEQRICRYVGETIFDVVGDEREPTHSTHDERMFRRQFQEPLCLGFGLPRLY
jgi:hypothetical protein